MSTFDIITDAPGLLRTESINITLKFDRTGPTTGRISWNIPTPAAGCTAETQAYCGMVVVLDTKPAGSSYPTKGQVYSADPTADVNLFAGDKIGTAHVVGGFYQDRTTTFFDVTGLKANTPYYVTGYPVDCELRYFIEGVHAYSMEFKNRGSDSTNGTQVVVLNSTQPEMGVELTDDTGLLPTEEYQFKIQLGVVPRPNRPVDSVECKPTPPTYTITVDGAAAQTYEDLVAEINHRLSLLSNAPVSPTPPNTGAYYWNNTQKKLYQWTGSAHVEVPVIVEATQPNTVVVGSYWYNPTLDVLSVWNGVSWDVATVIELETDPAIPLSDQTYWFDGTTLYLWNGVTWCEVQLYNQTTDPSTAADIPGGSYWYNEQQGVLYRWNESLQMWSVTTAVQSAEDPNALSTGTTWYNDVANLLYSYNTVSPGWNPETNFAVSETAPSTPAPGKYWFNPTTVEMFRRNDLNTAWVQVEVIVFPQDPTSRTSCDVWWDTISDTLSVWSTVQLAWVPVTSFYITSVDPSLPPTITEGAGWYNPSTGDFYVWVNACFVSTPLIVSTVDPATSIADGTVWFNPQTSVWKVRDTGAWVTIDPVETPSDPTMLASGTFWFNTSTQNLASWNGVAWVTVTYSLTPYTPALNSLWYDSANNVLKTWNGVAWIPATPIATVELDCNGNLLFTDTTLGSLSFVAITDVDLFESLSVAHNIHDPKPGTDGASDTPSYLEVGIGTDGSDAIRKQIANEIRYELGYPVVNVELTQEQIDVAISRAISTLRQRSGIAYKRGFFFMQIPANTQRFFLTNKVSGMNKIVDVLGIYRLTSSFLSSAHGAGVYGQIVLQHLYNMGTFDLLSYHIMGEYTKLMEMLFAARLTYTWNEQTRELWIHNRFALNERMVCIEATVERTEQDIMSDRYVQPWIRKYAVGICKLMLAEIRGKFSTLPGASGSVTLNAAELRQSGTEDMASCIEQIENYIVDKPEEYGIGTTFTFG